MELKLLQPNKSLNKAYLKEKVSRNNIETFKTNLKILLSKINEAESEEHHKYPVADFLKDTWYKDLYEINTKGRTDFVIHNGKNTKDPVGVIIEVKRPTNKAEMITAAKPNVKAMHELVFYYLRERIEAGNTDVKRLVITNVYEWFIFDEAWFDRVIYRSKLKKDYESLVLTGKDTKFFFESIAKPFLDALDEPVDCTYFDIRDYERVVRNDDRKDDNKLIALYKILSPTHLLIQPFANDSNSLDTAFYTELLHIIGLEEVKEGGKKLIRRKEKPDAASLLENAIIKLEDKDCLRNITGISGYGVTTKERLFNVALELCITWINRVLFIKLLEGQMVTYHKGDKDHLFLNIKTVGDFDELNELFFQVLAERTSARHKHLKDKFSKIPYLNSSLFERTPLERETIQISELNNRMELNIHQATVLKNNLGKKQTGGRMTLHYLFDFLDAYDFSSDGGDEIQEENKNLINASVLGLIFEKINGYKDGSFFTPGFITMYMCRETIRRAVLQKFKEVKGWDCQSIDELSDYIDKNKKKEASDIINSLKICDPAVGSGHFLVSALNEVISIKSELKILLDRQGKALRDYSVEVVNDELIVTDEDGLLLDYNPKNKESQRVQEALFHEKETIIESCLFGVDINPNSVKICRLRLWIELLKNAYYTAASNYTELETLPNIDINIKCGNSLISRFGLDADLGQALKKSKWTIDSYRIAVQTYRSAETKEQKRDMEELIENIKNNFRTEINGNDPKIKRLQKLNTEYYLKYQADTLFEARLTKAQKKDKATFETEITKLDTEIKEIKSNKIYENAFEWRFEFPEVLDDDGRYIGFDVIIGNPPYISIQDLRASSSSIVEYYKEKYSTARNNSFDIYIVFIQLSTQLIGNSGFITLILPNKFFSTDYGQPVRNFLVENKWLDKIVDFEHFQVFSDASIYTCILILNKSRSEKFKHTKVNPTSVNNTLLYFEVNESEQLLNKIWSFENEIQKTLVDKMSECSIPLIDIPALISRGSSTGCDSVFVLEYINGKLYDENKNEIDIEPNLLINPIYATDFGRYSFHDQKKYKLVFPYEHKDKVNLIEEDKLKKTFPKAYKYLLGKKNLLDARKQSGKWYGFSAARNLKIHATADILIPLLANRGLFSLSPDNIKEYTLLAGGGFSVTIKSDKFSPKYILGLLNSKLLFYILYRLSNKFRGGFITCTKQYFEQLPIKIASLDAQLVISNLVDNILAKKKKDQIANTTKLEQEIDQLVYQLYGLTEEEIKIVEGIN